MMDAQPPACGRHRQSLAGLAAGPLSRVTAGALVVQAADGTALAAAAPAGRALLAAWLLVEAARIGLRYWTTALTVGPDSIVLSTGVLWLERKRIRAGEIVGVDVRQGPLGRVLGYGDLLIESRGTDRLLARCMRSPGGLADLVGNLQPVPCGWLGRTDTPGSAAGPTPSR